MQMLREEPGEIFVGLSECIFTNEKPHFSWINDKQAIAEAYMHIFFFQCPLKTCWGTDRISAKPRTSSLFLLIHLDKKKQK